MLLKQDVTNFKDIISCFHNCSIIIYTKKKVLKWFKTSILLNIIQIQEQNLIWNIKKILLLQLKFLNS